MVSILFASFVALSLSCLVMADSWGPAYSLGPTSDTTAVIESYTTYIPGTPPKAVDYVFLWPGTSNGTSGLIQAGVDLYEDMEAACGAATGQWCLSASYFGVVDGQTTQLDGTLVPVDGDAEIGIHYKLGDDGITWTQDVYLSGEIVSTLNSYDGPLIQGGWGTGTECDTNCVGTASPQYYLNTTITLSGADPNFSSTLGKGVGVVASSLETADGGITWTVASIMIPTYTA